MNMEKFGLLPSRISGLISERKIGGEKWGKRGVSGADRKRPFFSSSFVHPSTNKNSVKLCIFDNPQVFLHICLSSKRPLKGLFLDLLNFCPHFWQEAIFCQILLKASCCSFYWKKPTYKNSLLHLQIACFVLGRDRKTTMDMLRSMFTTQRGGTCHDPGLTFCWQ